MCVFCTSLCEKVCAQQASWPADMWAAGLQAAQTHLFKEEYH